MSKSKTNDVSVDSDDDVNNDDVNNDDVNNDDTQSTNTNDNNSEDELELDENDAKLKMLKNLKYDFASYEIKYIYDTYLKNDGEVDLSPSYQREFSWTNDKQDLFIDSVVNNYIIPPIILIKLNKKSKYRYECMDGQHRLTVLKHYIEGTPINKNSHHYIKYLRKENDKQIDVFYKETDSLEKYPKNKRYMTDDELNSFNDKKLIVIKISNFDKKMDETFDKIKNEMFLRLQKGERVSGTDILRNYDSPLVNTLREYNLLKYKTFTTHDTFKRIENILELKTKKTNMILSSYIFFVIRCILIIKNNTLDVGLLNETTLREEILGKKQSDRFNIDKKHIVDSLDKLKKFITRVYKMKEQEELPKFNEYFLLILLKIYLDEKDKLNEKLEQYDKYAEYNNDKYYQKLFNKNINRKIIKIFHGKYLDKPYDLIKNIDIN
jgi:hypothetical protein